jgi:hypothetical protein
MLSPASAARRYERDLFHARFAREVHDLHDLGVGQVLIRLEVDHLPALGHVLELLLELGHEVVLVVELDAAEEGRRVLLDRHHDRLRLVFSFLGVPGQGELHVHALLEHGRDHHEDDEQHDHDVGHGRDVDVRHRRALPAADCH